MSNELLNITIDGIGMSIPTDTAVKDALIKLGMITDDLRTLPLAVQLGGKVYGLNYRLRRDCDIKVLRYGTEAGRRVYERSLKFILICAVTALFPYSSVTEHYSLGKGVFFTFDKDTTNDTPDPLTHEDVKALENKCREIVAQDISFRMKKLSKAEACEFFEKDGQKDKCDLLEWRKDSYFNVYMLDGYNVTDYFYGEMLPSTGFVKVFALEYLNGGLVMLLPDQYEPSKPYTYVHPQKLARVLSLTDEWCVLMDCATVSDLNRHVKDGTLREIIRVNEIFHEREYAYAADEIIKRGARAVLVAGPSSSGKTTSANRISAQLKAYGKHPIPISLDNYYIDRDKLKPDINGEIDLETIHALDVDRFSEDLEALIAGKEVEVPIFNFKTQKREKHGMILRADESSPLVIEGIHGLNPEMLTVQINPDKLYRIYLSALTTLNLDNHNRIRTSDVRLIRRLVRDYATRHASMEHTLSMWDSVRRGEERWIFPYQEQADLILNTTLLYELTIMKHYVYDLLREIPPQSMYYTQARELVKFLNYFEDADADIEKEIPPTSVMREFIGGNVFYE